MIEMRPNGLITMQARGRQRQSSLVPAVLSCNTEPGVRRAPGNQSTMFASWHKADLAKGRRDVSFWTDTVAKRF